MTVFVKKFWSTFDHPHELSFKDVDWADAIERVEGLHLKEAQHIKDDVEQRKKQ